MRESKGEHYGTRKGLCRSCGWGWAEHVKEVCLSPAKQGFNRLWWSDHEKTPPPCYKVRTSGKVTWEQLRRGECFIPVDDPRWGAPRPPFPGTPMYYRPNNTGLYLHGFAQGFEPPWLQTDGNGVSSLGNFLLIPPFWQSGPPAGSTSDWPHKCDRCGAPGLHMAVSIICSKACCAERRP